VEYDESPCRKRTKEELLEDQPSGSGSGRVPEPEEIIELPVVKTETEAPTLQVTEPEAEAEEKLENKEETEEDPPKKTPRIRG